MAHCETQAIGKCACCGGPVAVKINVAKKAYYRCDNQGCGVEIRHHWQSSSDKFMRQFAPKGSDAIASAPAAIHGDSQPKKSVIATLLG